MTKVERYFRIAKQVALKGNPIRRNRLGAVGIRCDGAMVASNNMNSREQDPRIHAEARLVRKLDYGSDVYVVRVMRSGELGIARPCIKCQNALRIRGVRRVYYSISDTEYGIMNFS